MNKIKILNYLLFLIFTVHCQISNKDRIICNNSDKQRYFQDYKIYAFDTYEQGLNCSKYTNKPIIIYFNAYGIGMDVFSTKYSKDRELTELINNEFIAVILTVDDQTKIDNSDRSIGQRTD